MNSQTISREDVLRLFGDVSEHAVLEVLASGATPEHLETVALWLAQEDDVLGDARQPLTGKPAQVLALLESDAPLSDEDR
jgi:hypothetical protein